MLHTFDKTSIHTEFLIWISLATTKDSAKAQFKYVYATENGDIVATDGHRCHVYTPEDSPLAPGYYEINKRTKTALQLVAIDHPQPYPDYARVFPGANNLVKFTNKSPGTRFAQVIRALDVNSLDLDYFKQAACQDFITHVQVKTGISPVMFTGDKVKALVMPLRA